MQRRHQIERDYSAQSARAKISTSPIFHATVQVLKLSRFLFSRFDRGSRKFGPRENFPLYGTFHVRVKVNISLSNSKPMDLLNATADHDRQWAGCSQAVSLNHAQ